MDGKQYITYKKGYSFNYNSNDVDGIVTLLECFAKEAESDLFNAYHIKNFILSHKDHEDGVIITLENNGKTIGVICGMVRQHVYDPEKIILVEMAWYVDKKHRATKYSLKLLKLFEQKGKELGVCKIFVTLRSSLKSVEKVYTRLGYIEEEKTFSRDI